MWIFYPANKQVELLTESDVRQQELAPWFSCYTYRIRRYKPIKENNMTSFFSCSEKNVFL